MLSVKVCVRISDAVEQQVPPLRCAPVGMTKLWKLNKLNLQAHHNLSSRPKRSAVEGPADYQIAGSHAHSLASLPTVGEWGSLLPRDEVLKHCRRRRTKRVER